MNRKRGNILIACGAIVAVLLVALIAYLLMRDGLLQELFGKESSTAAEESPTSPKPTEKASEPAGSTETETAKPTEPPAPKTFLRMGVKSLQGRFSPFYEASGGDEAVLELTQLKLLTLDRSGLPVENAAEGDTRSYDGKEYTYIGPASIRGDYDAENNITTYRVKLRSDLYFSDGVQVTADDLIFNYYMLLQPEFDGKGMFRSYPIVGLLNYYYNNSAAETVVITDEMVADRLKNAIEVPVNDVISDYIREIMHSTLESEMKLFEDTWATYQSIHKANSALELFYSLYGLDLNYSLPDKTAAEVVDDVTVQYGMNYQLLADSYACDPHYFDEQIQNYVRERLQYEYILITPGENVDSISGIRKLGDYEISISVYGFAVETIYNLFDIYIAPMHYYGNPDCYDYDAHRFGFIRGGLDFEKLHVSEPMGAGPYRFVSYDPAAGTAELAASGYYWQGKPKQDLLRILKISPSIDKNENEALAYALFNNEIDIASVEGDKGFYEQIRWMNANDSLCGTAIQTLQYPNYGYSYIGINASMVNVGGIPDSDASVALRRAFATLFAAYRGLACREYYGDAACVLDYPISGTSWASPRPGDDGYREAYSVIPDPELGADLEIYRENMTEEERFLAALDAAKSYLRAAGYSFDEANGTVTEAPEGGTLRFEVLVCLDETGNSVYTILERAASALYGIGLTLDIRPIASNEDLWISLYMEGAQMWVSSWNDYPVPDYYSHYHSSQSVLNGYNFYNINAPELDAMLEELQVCEDLGRQAELYGGVMNTVLDWAVEVPCLQKQEAVIYSGTQVLNGDILQDLTIHSPLTDYIWGLEVKPLE